MGDATMPESVSKMATPAVLRENSDELRQYSVTRDFGMGHPCAHERTHEATIPDVIAAKVVSTTSLTGKPATEKVSKPITGPQPDGCSTPRTKRRSNPSLAARLPGPTWL